MKRRSTLIFKSGNENEYLYDDVTSMIFPWNDLKEKILTEFDNKDSNQIYQELKDLYDNVNLKHAIEEIDYWRNKVGGFYEDFKLDTYNENDDIIDYVGDNLTRQLILSVTDDCNLRCKYCVYSETYSLTKNKTCNYMTIETAKKAIDYFYKLVRNQMIRNPRKVFGITFYGGEPLMNMEVIRFSVEYIKKIFDNRIYFMITSNGLLLNDENIKFLAENEIGMAISLDGPDEQHDRLRVRVNGEGSYNKVFENIQKLKSSYPEYFRTRVNAVCVFDPNTDIKQVEKFYEVMEITGDIPRAIFVNRVSDNNTDYFSIFNQDDYDRHNNQLIYLKDKYFDKKINDDKASSYLSSIIGSGPLSIITRRRLIDIKGKYIPSSGACIPGQKICVNSNGTFDICERVNGHNYIGNADIGIDEGMIRKIISEYREKVLKNCERCVIKRICGLCYLNFETEEGFKMNKNVCINHLNVVKNNLSNYVTICEENPDCEFFFTSDTAKLSNSLTSF